VVSKGGGDCCRVGRVSAVFAVIYPLVFIASTFRFRTLRLASMLLSGIRCSNTFALLRLGGGRGLGFGGLGQLSRALN
jgi:hypothetical protein